jgi:hypothetical protein
VRRAVRLAVIDLGPVRRHRDFRLLVAGRGVSFLGSMVTYVAIRTRSTSSPVRRFSSACSVSPSSGRCS